MRYFKATGLWTPNEDAKHPIAGTLRYSTSGLRLTLIGNFRSGWSPSVGTAYPIIHGVVGKSPYGNFVTLYDCHTARTTMNMTAVGSETISCRRAIVGDDHPTKGEAEYGSLDLRFTYLDEWVGWRNIEIDWNPGGGKELVIGYSKPTMNSFSIGDRTLKVGYSFSVADSGRKAGIREKAHLIIEPIGHVTAERAGDDYSYRLQNLLTFATDVPNEVEDSLLLGELVSYGNVDIPKEFHLLYNPVYRRKGPRKRLRVEEMLFCLGDARDAGLNIFQNWFDFANRHEAFFVVYFAHLYAPPRYLDDKFRDVMAAFNLLVRSPGLSSNRTKSFLAAVNSALGSCYDAEEREWLSHAVPDDADVEAPFQLMRLLQENGEIMRKIIGGDFREFVASVCRTLTSVRRRTSPSDRPVLQGPDLHYATEKLRWLIKAAVLKELGFNEERVKSLFERNTNFNYLRGV